MNSRCGEASSPVFVLVRDSVSAISQLSSSRSRDLAGISVFSDPTVRVEERHKSGLASGFLKVAHELALL